MSHDLDDFERRQRSPGHVAYLAEAAAERLAKLPPQRGRGSVNQIAPVEPPHVPSPAERDLTGIAAQLVDRLERRDRTGGDSGPG